MRTIGLLILLCVFMFIPRTESAMAIEEAAYRVVKTEGPFELRDYEPHIVAETTVDGELEEVGSVAFRRLFAYISGANTAQTEIAMTTPVSQQSSEKIAMTAPVGQQKSGDRWLVSFMMPASYRMETLPIPDDPQVTIRQVPPRRIAAVRYSGFWSEKNYQKNMLKLGSWIEKEGLKVTGEAIWARYNSPFSLWFLRRNEILVPVAR
jgi:effector-binding domain-containing protein